MGCALQFGHSGEGQCSASAYPDGSCGIPICSNVHKSGQIEERSPEKRKGTGEMLGIKGLDRARGIPSINDALLEQSTLGPIPHSLVAKRKPQPSSRCKVACHREVERTALAPCNITKTATPPCAGRQPMRNLPFIFPWVVFPCALPRRTFLRLSADNLSRSLDNRNPSCSGP